MKRLLVCGWLMCACGEPAFARHADAGAPDGTGDVWRAAVLARLDDTVHELAYAGGRVLVSDYPGDRLLVFDALSRARLADVSVGHGPTAVASHGDEVLVVNAGARDLGDAYLSVIDAPTGRLVRSLVVDEKVQGDDPLNYPWTNFPADAAVGGDSLFVAFPGNPVPDVLPVDLRSWTEGTMWAAGSGPNALAVTGGRVLVANLRNLFAASDDALAVYGTDGTPILTWESGGSLHDVVAAGAWLVAARSPAGQDGEVLAIDSATLAERTIATGAGAYGLAAVDQTVYVGCAEAGEIDIVDLVRGLVAERIDVAALDPTLAHPRGLAVTPDGAVFFESDGAVAVVFRE